MKQGYYWAIRKNTIPHWEVVWVQAGTVPDVYAIGDNRRHLVDEFRDYKFINQPNFWFCPVCDSDEIDGYVPQEEK